MIAASILLVLLYLVECTATIERVSGGLLKRKATYSPRTKSVEAASSTLENHILPRAAATAAPNPCLTNSSQLGYVFGELSAAQTFYNCLQHVANPQMIATFYNNQYNGVFELKSSITLNNLDTIDEIEGSAKLQFSLRLYWEDDRFAMPVFWAHTDNQTRETGIDLTTIITNDSIALWMPEIRFPDASSVTYQAEYLKLNASNMFSYGAGLECVLLQPKFNFRKYPNDKQTIDIRFATFNYPSDLAVQGFVDNPLRFNEFYDGTETFKNNAIWSYDSSNYFTSVNGGFSYAWYQVNVERMGSGIVIRLVLPITLLVLLASLTFWASEENRIEIAITLLLAISALYIVILGNIPLVGYLTTVDSYVFAMFIVLVFVCVCHQLHFTLSRKQDIWPLRIFYCRAIEAFGRAVLIPYVMLFFVMDFEFGNNSGQTGFIFSLAIVFVCTLSLKEFAGVYVSYIQAMQRLVAKINDDETTLKHVSWFELLVINVIIFRKISASSIYLVEFFAGHDLLYFQNNNALQGMRVKEMGKSQTYSSDSVDTSRPKDAGIELKDLSNSTTSAIHVNVGMIQQRGSESYTSSAYAAGNDHITTSSQVIHNKRASQRRSSRFTPGFVESEGFDCT